MEIYLVQQGDTVESIAEKFGVSVAKLIKLNELENRRNLVPGETIVIVYPSQTYIVRIGDSLESIASSHNITINELLRNNPFLVSMSYIYPGEELVISYLRSKNILTHGYANTFINEQIYRKTLPYLTYLTILNYRTTQNGNIITFGEDKRMIELAKEYGVVPLMLMTTLSIQGDADLELTYDVLINEEMQNRLFDNVMMIIKEKGYLGVNISAQFITSSNQTYFYNYTRNLSTRLRQEGYEAIISVNPRIEHNNQGEVIFDPINYSQFNRAVDSILFLQYKWGITSGPPTPVSSIYDLSVYLEYAITQVPPENIFVGLQTLGYDWELPFATGYTNANLISIADVMVLAESVGTKIEFDERSQTPYFRYEGENNSQHIVWFVNAQTVESLITMIQEKGIVGTGIWNIMKYFAQLWLIVNSQYKIVKLLPEF